MGVSKYSEHVRSSHVSRSYPHPLRLLNWIARSAGMDNSVVFIYKKGETAKLLIKHNL